jgi:hypothetical protein
MNTSWFIFGACWIGSACKDRCSTRHGWPASAGHDGVLRRPFRRTPEVASLAWRRDRQYPFAMRIPVTTIANGTAWAVLICLIAVAFVVVVILGPFALIILGLLTLFICTSVSLREDAPTSGTEVFRLRMARHSSPEQRAAVDEARGLSLAPLRFYRWCGIMLLLAGVAGFAWQQLH